MPLLPFGEYRPDVADYEGQISGTITNVVPRADGYGPFNALAPFSSAIAAACRGIFYAIKTDGSVQIFAGTSDRLYALNNINQTWTDVSKGGSAYSALSSNAQWQFAQFNNFVFATQVNAVVQVFDLTSSTTFDDLGGSPPQAAYIAIVNRFVVLSGIASPNVYRVQWSGFNAPTTWTSGTNQSDFQDLADGGIVRSIAGGEFGVIFQDRAIRRMIYSPGSPYIFGIDRIANDDGLFAPYSVVNAGDRIFFISHQGFKMIPTGGYPTPIGKERFDRTFFADVDNDNLQLVIGASDPRHNRVYWAYKSINGGSGQFDKVLCYDWSIDRASLVNVSGEYLVRMAQPGLTLEGVDAAFGQTGTPVTLEGITSATPAVFTKAAHGLTEGIGLLLSGTLPTGLASQTPYYVLASNLTASTFIVSSTGGIGAFAGTAKNTTSSVGSNVATYMQVSVDSLNIPSLDDISAASIAQLAAVDSTHKLGLFTGETLEANLITSEHGADGRRIFVSGFVPVTDAASCYGSLQYRENQQSTESTTSEVVVNSQGLIPQRQSARYARGKVRIPAGTDWTFASGVEPKVRLEGER